MMCYSHDFEGVAVAVVLAVVEVTWDVDFVAVDHNSGADSTP